MKKAFVALLGVLVLALSVSCGGGGVLKNVKAQIAGFAYGLLMVGYGCPDEVVDMRLFDVHGYNGYDHECLAVGSIG